MRRALWWACYTSAAACAPEVFVTDVPFSAEDHSAIIAVEYGTHVEAIAVDAADRDLMPVLRRLDGAEAAEDIHITAFFFEHTLEELLLSPGPMPRYAVEGSQELTGWRAAYDLHIEEKGITHWEVVTHLADELSEIRIPLKSPCRPLSLRRFDLGTDPYLAAFTALSSTTALAITFSGFFGEAVFHELSLDGARTLPTRIESFTPRAAVRGRDGRMYITGGDPSTFEFQLWAGDPRSGFERVHPREGAQPSTWVWSLAAPNDASDSAMFYGTSEIGEVYRFEDEEWERIAEPDVSESGTQGVIAWSAKSELYTISPEARRLHHYRDGALTLESTPVTADLEDGLDRLTGLAHIEGLGTFSGSASGFIMERVDGGGAGPQWQQVNVEALIANVDIRSFAKLPSGGLAIGGGYGSIQQLHRGWGLCLKTGEVTYISNTVSVNQLVSVEGGLLFAGVENPGETERLIIGGALTELSDP